MWFKLQHIWHELVGRPFPSLRLVFGLFIFHMINPQSWRFGAAILSPNLYNSCRRGATISSIFIGRFHANVQPRRMLSRASGSLELPMYVHTYSTSGLEHLVRRSMTEAYGTTRLTLAFIGVYSRELDNTSYLIRYSNQSGLLIICVLIINQSPSSSAKGSSLIKVYKLRKSWPHKDITRLNHRCHSTSRLSFVRSWKAYIL